MKNKEAAQLIRKAVRANYHIARDLSEKAQIDIDLSLGVKLGKMTAEEAAGKYMAKFGVTTQGNQC